MVANQLAERVYFRSHEAWSPVGVRGEAPGAPGANSGSEAPTVHRQSVESGPYAGPPYAYRSSKSVVDIIHNVCKRVCIDVRKPLSRQAAVTDNAIRDHFKTMLNGKTTILRSSPSQQPQGWFSLTHNLYHAPWIEAPPTRHSRERISAIEET